MTSWLLLGGVIGLLIWLSRRPLPITDGDVRDDRDEVMRGDAGATPLPRSRRVTTRLRVWLSRHVVSRHEDDTDDSDAQWSESGSVEWAPGVHVSKPSLDEWVRTRLASGTDAARLAKSAATRYDCSLRTAQRAIQRARRSGR